MGHGHGAPPDEREGARPQGSHDLYALQSGSQHGPGALQDGEDARPLPHGAHDLGAAPVEGNDAHLLPRGEDVPGHDPGEGARPVPQQGGHRLVHIQELSLPNLYSAPQGACRHHQPAPGPQYTDVLKTLTHSYIRNLMFGVYVILCNYIVTMV